MRGDSTRAPIRVVISEDHQEARQTLARMINLQEEMEVVGEAADGIEALERVSMASPDVLLVDIRMPRMDGIHVIRTLRKSGVDLRVIVLSAHEDEAYVAEALRHGADGYILKGLSVQTIVEAIREVIKGKAILSPDITKPLVKNYRMADAVISGFHQSLDPSGGPSDTIKRFLEEITAILEVDFSCIFGTGSGGVDEYDLLEHCSCENGGEAGVRSGSGNRWLKWLNWNMADVVGHLNGTAPVVLNDYRYLNGELGAPDADGFSTNMLLMPIFTWNGQRGLLLCFRDMPFSSSSFDTRYVFPLVGQLGLLLENLAHTEQVRSLEGELEQKSELLRALLGVSIDSFGLDPGITGLAVASKASGVFLTRTFPDGELDCISSWNVKEKAVDDFLNGAGKSMLHKLESGEPKVNTCVIEAARDAMLVDPPDCGVHMLLVPLLSRHTAMRPAGGGNLSFLESGTSPAANGSVGGTEVEEAGSGTWQPRLCPELLGVLGLFYPEGRVLSSRDEFTIEFFAERVAVHIEEVGL